MKRSFLIVSFLIICQLSYSQVLDTDFSFGFKDTKSSNITCVAHQSDGKIILGGYYFFINDIRLPGIVRLNKDYTIDNSFSVPFKIYLTYGLAIQEDGKILISGFFEDKGTRFYMARLNSDGSVDDTFYAQGLNGMASNIKILSNKKIILIGTFNAYNNVPAEYIVLLNEDGSHDTSFSGKFTHNIQPSSILEQSDGKIIITGSFEKYNDIAMYNILRMNPDGSIDYSFNFNDFKRYSIDKGILLKDDEMILAGYNISTINNDENGNIVKTDKDGRNDDTFTISSFKKNTIVYSLIRQKDGRFLVGYSNGIVRINQDGTIDDTFNYTSDYSIRDIAETENGIFALRGNGFDILDDKGNNIGIDIDMYDVPDVEIIYPKKDGNIIFGGSFNDLNGQSCKSIMVCDKLGNINSSFDFFSDQFVYKYYPYINETYFMADNDIGPKSLTANDFAVMNSDGTLNTLYDFPTSIYMQINDVIILDDGSFIFGGTHQDQNDLVPIIKLNPDCSIDDSFYKDQTDLGTIFKMYRLDDDKILVFGQKKLTSDYYIERINPDGTTDASFSNVFVKQNTVGRFNLSFEVNKDGKIYIGGSLVEYGGEPVKNLVRINPDGSLDNSFSIDEEFTGDINIIKLQEDGKIIVGGSLVSYAQHEIDDVVRFNPDGSIDDSFVMPHMEFPGLINSINIIDGDIYVGGRFIRTFSPLSSAILKLSSGINTPENFEALATEPSLIELSWNDNSTGETGFIVERTDKEGGIYIVLDTVDTDITSFSDTGVSPETTYFYRIRAFNGVGSTQYISASATTPEFITGLSDLKQNGISIYPNPSSGNVHIALENKYTGRVNISISNILGETVYRRNIYKSNECITSLIDVSHLEKGLYVVSLEYQAFSFTKKLVIQN